MGRWQVKDFLTDLFDKDIRELRKAEKEERKAERAADRLERQAAKVTGSQVEEKIGLPKTSISARIKNLSKIEIGKKKGRKASKNRELPEGLIPVQTSFDFLSGAVEKAKKTRIFNTGVSGVVAAALIVVGAQTTIAKIGADSDTRTIKALRDEQSSLKTSLQTNPNAVQYPQAELNSFVAEHSSIIQDILSEEPDVRMIASDLRSLAPAGLEITGVFFNSPERKPVDADEEVKKSEEKSAPASLGTVQIVAQATQYDLVAQWVKLITQMTYLKEAKTTWAGVPGDLSTVTITTRATISTDVASERTKQAKDADGLDKDGNFKADVIPDFLKNVYSQVQEGRVVQNG